MVREDLTAIAEKERAARKPMRVRCCMAAGCLSSRSAEIKTALEKAVNDNGMTERVEVGRVGCMGLCGQGPLVGVDPEGLLYEHVTPENAPSIVTAFTRNEAEASRGDLSHPFFTSQVPVVLAHCGRVDPERIEEYIEAGGYSALHHVLFEMEPAQVIEAIAKSGLRGRGGAGYPTGLKWATVAKSTGAHKYVICNGD